MAAPMKDCPQMDEFHLFSSSEEENRQIALSLHKIGCCPRCILRFLGELQPASFSITQEAIKDIFLQGEDKEDEVNLCPCPACLGILQGFAEMDYLLKIKEKVAQDGYQFSDYQCSLMLPVSVLIRQKAVYLHLVKTFGEIYPGKEDKIASVKDVWKWSCGPRMTKLLDAKFQSRSAFDILLTFTHQDSVKECSFLLDLFPDTFKKRKQRMFGYETFTRANVSKALTELLDSQFEDCSSCPPPLPVAKCTCEIMCSHEAVFIAGRYNKYSRELSQTPWIIDGKRAMEGSVQELICSPILETFKPASHRLSSSGREDVDVLMLGSGRPFVVELINPHCVRFSQQELSELQKRINDSTDDVQVRDLQLVSREDTNKLKEGEISKTKSYSALCWAERELTDDDLAMLDGIKDLVLQQKTPIRVLHRRTAATRDRTIHSVRAVKGENKQFKLYLTTQAGTYIKEFVHGDFGRTQPNMSELLKAECDIISLDVESVDVDWPPALDTEGSAPETCDS